MSDGFQPVSFGELQFPATYLIDYVRVYQRKGQFNLGCSPKDMPTEDYINDHINAYTNPNLTTWEAAGYSFPRSSMDEVRSFTYLKHQYSRIRLHREVVSTAFGLECSKAAGLLALH